MDYVLIGVVLLLLAVVFVLFYKNKQLESESQQVEFEKKQAIETYETEIAATVTEHKEQQNTLKNIEQKKYNDLQISAARELENMRMMKNQLAVQHSKERSEMQEKHSNEIHMFQKLIANLREYTKNGAEVNTHETLHYMKRGFVEQGIILDTEFHIMPNVFIRNQHGGNDCRIHHLVLSKTGMYLLETKEWTGKLIHGLTKENASIYSFMIDEIGKYQQEVEKEETFECVTGEDSLTIQVKNEGNPVYRAKKLSHILYNYLKEIQVDIVKEKVKPIVYFYNESGKEVLDLSEEKTPRLKDREQIVTFFRNEILTGKVIYTDQELEKLREIISRMNYKIN
ncbi:MULTISPECIES: nuclease-related domain-containing protein [Bacillus cereus group]|uniref:NERD domain-containing protein n=1 Tax=Bacillus thuringiensis TaxID=1428 RepID=A0A1C4FDW6_BACTU|nr:MULTISPECIES: nuclease-related domain-containing protein [Bacillus cereus group]MCC2324581.1 NERD domain-containing protein [Bacillus wiedmannii]MDP1457456.1 nuclease-related domain-containing protein [Bacillus wiedmannii]MED3023037.1 nuclease-related domain-containing protein [Bacillus wiedmannii]OTX93854.1 chromosome segregation protein [Bacillus thuringiensis serovar wratislaviensis]OUB63796.1 chromosome segregation protein [Bacillus thuringiensis serovar sylvestriensis]